MITAILMAAIVFLAMFLGRFMPWERLLRRKVSAMETVVAVIFSISIPYSILAIIEPAWTSCNLILSFWGLCGSAVIGSAVSSFIVTLLAARSRADEAEEREERLIRRIKK
jgi:uncharacterized membrane protein (DUF4010 family)